MMLDVCGLLDSRVWFAIVCAFKILRAMPREKFCYGSLQGIRISRGLQNLVQNSAGSPVTIIDGPSIVIIGDPDFQGIFLVERFLWKHIGGKSFAKNG